MVFSEQLKTAKHQWLFNRLGGFDQVQLHHTDDLLALPELDQKLWAVLSCPAQGLQIAQETLNYLDVDQDGRIRVPEVIAAVQWATKVLNDPNELLSGTSELYLSSIAETDVEGAKLLASAQEILKNLNKPDALFITIEDLADMAKIFANTQFNGDGVIPVKAADSDDVKQLIEEIISCCGSELDRCGEPGVTQEKIDQFFLAAQAYADWWALGEENAARIAPFNQSTETAASSYAQVKTKIDDYFTRCQLADYDTKAGEVLNPSALTYEQLGLKNLAEQRDELMTLPLATIAANRDLPLKSGLNPAWLDAITQFQQELVLPLYGDIAFLTQAQWHEINEKFTDYLVWQQEKQGGIVEILGINRIKYVLNQGQHAVLLDLIEQDLALTPEAEAIESVRKLVFFCRDLNCLLNNFVNLNNFYAIDSHSIFQMGTLYVDGKSCHLCIRVNDIAKHSAMAALSGIYLIYCECSRPGSAEKMNIVAAVTNGDADNLMLGRNGVFYDKNGLDWDATIVKIIDNPISIKQAFWLPYKRVSRMIGEQVEKFAAAKDKEQQAKAAENVAGANIKPDATVAAPPQPFDVARFAGIFAAIGLAIGAIGTAIASLVSGFLALSWWQMPLAIIGLMLVISGPSMLLAWLKLRQRNLAPLLDASGWAVNAKALINLSFGGYLTNIAKLPSNSVRQLLDPFAEKAQPWRLYGLIVILVIALLFLLMQQGVIPNLLAHWFSIKS